MNHASPLTKAVGSPAVNFPFPPGLLTVLGLLLWPAPASAQVEPPVLWTFITSFPADVVVPAETPEGGVVIVRRERPSRVQKIQSNGTLAWQHDLTWEGVGWPVVLEDGAVLIAEGAPSFGVGRLRCYEADGTVRWNFEPGGSPVIPPVVEANGKIWIACTDPDTPPTTALIRLSRSGELELRRSLGVWVHGPGAILADGQLILPMDGRVVSIDSSGTTRWSTEPHLTQAAAPALAADGTIVVTSANGWLLLVNPDGSIRRKHWPGLEMMAPLIGADGTLYVLRSDGKIDVRDRHGELIRQLQPPTFPDIWPGQLAPALANNGWLWLPLRNGQIVAYGPAGDLVARWSPPASTFSGGAPLLRTDGSLVVGFYDFRVRAFGNVGAPLPDGWPLLGGNPARTAHQMPLPLPEAPTGLTATKTNNAVRLEWDLPPGLVTCEVWRGGSANFTEAVRVAAFLVEREWTDRDVVAGYEYWYWVRARNAAGYGPLVGPVHLRIEVPVPGGFVARLKVAEAPLSAPAQGPDGTLYLGDFKGGVTALAPNGTRNWRFATGREEAISMPLVAPDGSVCFTATLSGIFCLNPDGTLRWNLPYRQPYTAPPPPPALNGQGLLFVHGIQGDNQWALWISLAGEVLQTNWFGNDRGDYSAAVFAADDSFWVGGNSGLGRRDRLGTILWAVTASSSPRAWPLALDRDAEVLSGGRGSASGLSRFASDGRLLWQVGTNGVTAGAVVDEEGIAYFGDQAGLFRAVTRNGEVRWSVETGAPVSCTPALGNPDLVYVATEAGHLLALDRASGEERWRGELGARPLGGLLVAEPTELVVSTEDGVLHRVQLAGGVMADAPWPMLGRNAVHHGRLPAPLPALLAPEPVAATDAATNSTVVVTWNPVPGAAWYEVFRAPSPDLAGAVPLVTNVTRTWSFTDFFVPGNQPHWYWVRAAGTDGSGPWSEPVKGSQGARLWRVALSGRLHGPPVVTDDGTVVVLARTGPEFRATLVALSGATGAELWRRSTGETNFLFPARSMAPVMAEDGRIFFPGRRALACVSSTGELLWEMTGLTEAPEGLMALTRSGLLIYPSGNSIVARRATDGLLLWQMDASDSGVADPVVATDGTIWVCNPQIPPGISVINPNGTKRYSLRYAASLPPALSRSGHLIFPDRGQLMQVLQPDGIGAPLNNTLRSAVQGLAPAADQLAFVRVGAAPEVFVLNTNAQVLRRFPAGGRLNAGVISAVDREGNWYLAGATEVRMLSSTGAVLAVWSLASPPAPSGLVLSQDGTLFVAELSSLAAFRGATPPADDAWAMPRKDRRNSASWEEGLPTPELPTDFAPEPLASVNIATLRWNRPNTLTLLELWSGDSPRFEDAVRVLGPMLDQTNYTDWARQPGSTAYYWLRALDLNGQEVGRLGPVVSTTATGANLAWTAPLSWTGGQLSLAPDGTLYHLLQELTAYRPDGSVRWQQTEVRGFTGSQPVVAVDNTILGWRGREIYALSPEGVVQWRHMLQPLQSAAAEVAVSESGLVLVAGAFGLQALRLDGQKLWSVWDEAFNAVALGHDDTVYAVTQTSRQLRCFAPDGQLRWTAAVAGVFGRGLALDSTGRLLTPGSDLRLRWFTSLGEVAAELAFEGAPGEAVHSPVNLAVPLLRSKIYPDLIALLEATGARQTQVPLACSALTAAADGSWLVSSQGRLVCLAADGTLRWAYDLPAAAGTLSPTVLTPEGRIYFAGGATLYALDSALRPAATGWYTTRANNRRTGQWLPPQPLRPRFLGIARHPDGTVELQITTPPGTTNELQSTTDWQVWTVQNTFTGRSEAVSLQLAAPPTERAVFFRVRTIGP